MKRLRTALVSGLLLAAGCNSNQLEAGAHPTPTPPPTPTPQPTPTPVPCKFYGIDSSSKLWIIDPVAVTASVVGPTGISSMTDIAITPDDHIIGITSTKAYTIDPGTGAATQLAGSAWLTGQDALDALPDGRLIIGGGSALAIVDLGSGAVTPAGTMGGGYVFSGDIAATSATEVLASGKPSSGSGNDHLFKFDLSSDTSVDLGDLGAPKVFGLDYGCDGNLYGMLAQSPPKLIGVNGSTAATTMIGSMSGGPSTLWGAAGPASAQ